jgi:hypothetical protein
MNNQEGYIEFSEIYDTDLAEEYRAEQEECDRFLLRDEGRNLDGTGESYAERNV